MTNQASKVESLLTEIEAVMRGEHGVDWADHFGPLFQLVEDVRAGETGAEPRHLIGCKMVKYPNCTECDCGSSIDQNYSQCQRQSPQGSVLAIEAPTVPAAPGQCICCVDEADDACPIHGRCDYCDRPFAVETSAEPDPGFQARVHDWMAACFARPDAMEPAQRAFRFIEEALELVQASGTSREDVLRLVDYVYGRPSGVVSQEIGGVMVTLAGLSTAFGLSMAYAANAELDRCRENTEKIRAKDLAKPQRSPLPGSTAETPAKPAYDPENPLTHGDGCGCPRCYGGPL